MPNILLVEDDRALSEGIVLAVKTADIHIDQSFTLREARKSFGEIRYDLVILDINLPDGNGLDYLKEIKGQCPVMLLTANDMETDVVTGLELGATDYITKPFSLAILRARINTQLRNTELSEKDIFNIDAFHFDFDQMIFLRDGQAVELSKTEQRLLKILIQNRGMTLERSVLVDKIWTDGAEYVDENALSVTMKRLRDKLEENPSKPQYIRTVYGIGYSWK